MFGLSTLAERLIIYGVVATLIAGILLGIGYHQGVKQLWEYQAQQAAAAVVVVKKIEKVKETVRVPYIRKEIQIKEVFIPLEKEASNVPSRPNCNVTLGWLHYHNDAASGSGLDDGALDDKGDSGVTEAEAALTVATNYKYYHQVVNDLKACRGFVSGLKDATK